MVQQTFTDMEYANRKRTTRREAFLCALSNASLLCIFLEKSII